MLRKFLKLFVAYILLLLLARYMHTGHFAYFFLLWNLFLAWLPYALLNSIKKHKHPTSFWVGMISALLFLPNAPYLITDLVHLHSTNTHTLWLDVLLILSFAIAGLLLFVRCVQLILIHLNNRLHPGKHLFLICKILLMTVCAYGVYVGRYLRFNSWDVFTHPLHLAEQMGRSILDPAQVRGTMAITISLSAFLFLIYELYENYQVHLSRSALDHQKT